MPPGWPAQVRPPGAPGWERSAVAWLFDLCPPDYRSHEVCSRHPVVLAHLATHHVQAGVAAGRRGLSSVREDLRGVVDPETVAAAVAAYEQEVARLVVTARALDLVARALGGERFVARL